MVFSPLISMATSPVATRRDRAATMNTTSATTIAVNMPTPKAIVRVSMVIAGQPP